MSTLVPAARMGFLCLLVALVRSVPGVEAATFTVDRNDDEPTATSCTGTPNDCSLRGAIIAANGVAGADEIVVPAGTYTLTVAGTDEDTAATGDLDIRGDLALIGDEDATTIIEACERVAPETPCVGIDRVFDIRTADTVLFSDVTIRHGEASAGGGVRHTGGGTFTLDASTVTRNAGTVVGGGVSSSTGTVVINGSTIADNSAATDGGGISIGTGTVTVTAGTITSNTAGDDGGGIHASSGSITINGTTVVDNAAVMDGGGLSTTSGAITAVRSLVDGNEAGEDGGGVRSSAGDIQIIDSTLSGNSAGADGAGVRVLNGALTVSGSTLSGNTATGDGGAVFNTHGATTMTNSTLSGNTAAEGGGVYFGLSDAATGTFLNVTLSANTATNGATFFKSGNGLVTVTNTIVDGASPNHCNNSGTLTSGGNNIESTNSSCGFSAAGDLVSTAPLLGPLQDNGGTTETHDLCRSVGVPDASCTGTSPAIEAGSNIAGPLSDQRGVTRPQLPGATVDIGAVESAVPEDCDNVTDDDGDGLVDCDDFGCLGDPACPERCASGVDDDADGAIDRADDDCPASVDGAMKGVGDPKGRGKLVVKCAKGLQRTGAKHATGVLKALQKCFGKLFDCVQKKPGDQRCLDKAGASCTKVLAKIEAAELKNTGAIAKACGVLSAADLGDASGLGYTGEEGLCSAFGVPVIDDAGDIATCLLAQHACHAQEISGIEFPRAQELLVLGAVDASALTCLRATADGAGAGLGVLGKAAATCQKTVYKAGGKFVGGKLKLVQKCALSVFTCHQQKPDDAKCLPKARAKCQKSIAKLVGLEEKLAATIAKKCDVAALTANDVVGVTGLGFQLHAEFCRALGVGRLESAGEISACVRRQHEYLTELMLERELPRLRELLATAEVALP